MTLEDVGYSNIFEEQRKQYASGDALVARVISESKGEYRVKNDQGEYRGKITGKQMFEAVSREDYPAVGDWVIITQSDDERVVIHTVLPRVSILKRIHGDKNRSSEKNDVQVIATNIDTAFVIESVDRDYNLNRFERYFAIAQSGGVKPVIILNKIDLLLKEEVDARVAQLHKRFPAIDVILTSTIDEEGLDTLRTYIVPKKTYCFLGSSGVGKSSLINKLLGEEYIKTGAVSSYSGRGTHTTTTRQMYFLENGGIVIDNPGIREVGVVDMSEGTDVFFDEIRAIAENCRYTDCTHTHEPGCKVVEAVKLNEIDKEKYRNYLTLKKETQYHTMSDIQKREKDRAFGKFIKKAKKDFKDLDI